MNPTAPPLRDWRELTDLTRGVELVVERVRIADSDIAIEGAFALPRLAQLTMEDQVFIAAFVRAHGSIKEMEQVFGVSYPTIKARLNRLAALLDFVETAPHTATEPPPGDDIIDRLARGELSAEEAILALSPSPRDATP
jgi:hypothetical protein